MANHLHLIAVAWDAEQCKKFYMELQRKITGYMKRLLGTPHLNLWEGTPMVAEVLDVEKAIDRIRYLYCNPARADLVETISKYPGLSSWEIFESGVSTHSLKVLWIRFPFISPLRNLNLASSKEQTIVARLRQRANVYHELTIEPDAWMRCFGIMDKDEADLINARIKERIKESESAEIMRRARERKSVLGATYLRQAAIYKRHSPKKKGNKVFVLSSISALRISYISHLKALCARCAELYNLARQGVRNLSWPPGIFLPPLPPLASAVGSWE